MKKMKVFAVCSLTIASLLLVGCASSNVSEETKTETMISEETAVEEGSGLKTEYPLTIEIYNGDSEKISMTYEKAPERIVSTQLSMTELLIELGLEDKIVGVLDNDNALSGELAEIVGGLNSLGDKKSVSKEAILAVEPDIILGKGPLMFADTAIGTVEFYQENGIDVYTELTSANIDQSLENVIEDVINIGKIFDVQERANAYADELREKLQAVQSKVSGQEGETKKVLLMAGYSEGTFVVFNSEFSSCVLETVNAINVVDQGGNGLTSENLVALNPDYIVYVKADRFAEVDKTAIENMYTNEAIQAVTAIANKDILEVAYDDVMDYGARNIEAIETLYNFIYE